MLILLFVAVYMYSLSSLSIDFYLVGECLRAVYSCGSNTWQLLYVYQSGQQYVYQSGQQYV